MGVPTIKTGPMTVEEFYALTDTRPDEERWELIEGEPVLNASPSESHQGIVKNISFILATLERRLGTTWEVLPGLGVRVSDTSRPQPDIVVIPLGGIPNAATVVTSSRRSKFSLPQPRAAICVGSVPRILVYLPSHTTSLWPRMQSRLLYSRGMRDLWSGD